MQTGEVDPAGGSGAALSLSPSDISSLEGDGLQFCDSNKVITSYALYAAKWVDLGARTTVSKGNVGTHDTDISLPIGLPANVTFRNNAKQTAANSVVSQSTRLQAGSSVGTVYGNVDGPGTRAGTQPFLG
jgi:hypothetical protein